MAQTHKFRKGKSLFSTTLQSGIGTGTGDTITLGSATGLPTDTEITLTFDRVDANGDSLGSQVERITGTISGSTLTSYTRGVDGTTEQAHSSNAVIEYIWAGDDWNDAMDGILVEHEQDGTHDATIVKTTGTQTLTNKTYVQKVTSYSPAGGATATLDLTTGNLHKITMPAGNITIAISNEVVGQCFMIEIVQDSVGSRTVTWFSTISWSGGSAPTLTTTANKKDTFGFRVTGTDTYDGYIVGQNV